MTGLAAGASAAGSGSISAKSIPSSWSQVRTCSRLDAMTSAGAKRQSTWTGAESRADDYDTEYKKEKLLLTH